MPEQLGTIVLHYPLQTHPINPRSSTTLFINVNSDLTTRERISSRRVVRGCSLKIRIYQIVFRFAVVSACFFFSNSDACSIQERSTDSDGTIADDVESEIASNGIPPLVFFVGNSSEVVEPTAEPQIVKEGHVTLRWQPHPDASGYKVIDQDKIERYQGRLARAFISGLPDGDYSFAAVALDDQANPIETSLHSIAITVQHHSLMTAGIIFAIGAAVMVTLVMVMIMGGRVRE